MTNINLATADLETGGEPSYVKGVVGLAAFFLLVIGIYIGLYFLQISMQGKMAQNTAAFSQELKKLNDENGKSIVDFQNRISLGTDLLNRKNPGMEAFLGLEGLVIPGVYIDSFEYENGILKFDCVADNFNTVARQVAVLKQSGFGDVAVGNSILNNEGKVDFSVEIKK